MNDVWKKAREAVAELVHAGRKEMARVPRTALESDVRAALDRGEKLERNGEGVARQLRLQTERDAIGFFGPKDVARRYATLFQAAPDLLEALKATLKWVEDDCDTQCSNPAQWPEVIAARAAIAKAEGKS